MRLLKLIGSLGLCLLATALTATAAPFTAGNLVVTRFGTGAAALTNVATPVFLDEYTTAGTLVQSIALPTADNGANKSLVVSGTATSEGQLTRSTNGNYLVLPGYNTIPGTASITTSTSAAINRVVAIVGTDGSIDTTTALNNYVSASNPRSAAYDGTNLWLTGGNGGVVTATKGATAVTTVATTATNLRDIAIFGGQLYVTSGSGAFRLAAVGTGTPTTSSQTIVNLPGYPTSGGSPYGFYFADLDAGVAGVDTVYVADDSAGSVTKYSLVSGSWTATGSITSVTGARGVTGITNGTTVTLYIVGANALYGITDATGYNVTLSGSATSLAAAPTNTAFRGIALAPENAVTLPAVSSTVPAASAAGVATNAAVTVTFNQAVTVAGGGLTLSSTAHGAVAANVTTSDNITYTITPTADFSLNDTITVTAATASITDLATGLQHPASDYVFSFTTAAPTAPSITTAPQAQVVNATGTATFTVVAGGTAPFTYQWLKDSQAITGNASATTDTLTLTNVQSADVGAYSVVVSNGTAPDATSTPVTLTVTPVAPTITTQPVGHTVTETATVTFTVAATGSTPFTYIWRKGGTPLADGSVVSGSTTATLTLTGVAVADSGDYDVVVSNGTMPDATSTAATLVVNAAVVGPRLDYAGGIYTQNFDTLPSAGTFALTGNGPIDASAAVPTGIGATGMAGWSFANYSGTGTNALFLVGNGSTTSGGVYSFGAASASDRAFGLLASGAQVTRVGLTLVNTTGQTITHFAVGYTGEQWRNGGNTAAQALSFSYSLDASNINTGTFVPVTALDFTSPVTGATAATLDGNLAANRTVIAPVSITGISWAPGATLTLRWTDLNDSGNDHGLAIDDLIFALDPASAPSITTAPQSQAVFIGGTATFTVVAGGTAPFTYQWLKDGQAITGNASATTDTLILTNVQDADNGAYSVVVSNTISPDATSAAATLAVTATPPTAPSITTAPQAQVVNATGTATFTVVAGGTAPFAYQWLKDGQAITGNASATTDTLTLTNVQAADIGAYSVVVSNGTAPDATSTPVTLTVTPVAPTITTQPLGRTVSTNATVTFTVAATGSTPFTYVWRKGGTPLAASSVVSGATTATLTLTGVTVADSGDYDVIVSNGTMPDATSTAATLLVNPLPPGPTVDFAGGTYTQNFDTLPASGTFTFTGNGPVNPSVASPTGVGATGMAGWSFANYGGTGANVIFLVGNGSTSNGAVYSYGASGASDRAFGLLASAAQVSRVGVAFVNTTGQTITHFVVGYTGEQWRNGGNLDQHTLSFAYSFDATDINNGTFVPVTALDFKSPVTGASATALDGNAAANRTVITPVTVDGISWAPGATLTLRWTDVNDLGSDHGLAIDDLTFGLDAPVAPTITTQPATQSVTALTSVTLTVAATGTAPFTYQWRKDGVAITSNASAATASLALSSATATDAGSYDCVITGIGGSVTSDAATLTVNKIPVTVTLADLVTNYDGTAKSLTPSVGQPGVKVTITYNGSATLPTASGTYTVVVTIDDAAYSGTATATITINGKVYIGSIGGQSVTQVVSTGGSSFAVALAPSGQDSTLLGTLPSGDAVIVKFRPAADGTFTATTTSIANPNSVVLNEGPVAGGTRSAAAAATLTFVGQVSGGVLSGTITELGLAFSAVVQADTGDESSLTGLYQAASLNSASGNVYTVVAADGSAYVLAISPSYIGAGTGTVASDGTFTIAASTATPGTVSGTLSGGAVTGSLTVSGQAAQPIAGLGADVTPTDRLVNLSSRQPIFANSGDSTAIIGFVITGPSPKQVLLRAVGPGVSGSLPNPAADPQLRVFDGQGNLITANDDWGGGTPLVQAFATFGATPLPTDSKDAAVLLTLAPGVYSMHVFTTGTAGNALGEIYDASTTSATEPQRLINISARGAVGTGNDLLIAGFVVNGNTPKRVLIRGVGPGIASAVSGSLADPVINVYKGSDVIARNDNWGTPVVVGSSQTAATAAELSASASRTGAATLVTGSKDAAVLITLAPGVYSAVVSGANNGTGIALVEVYEDAP